MRALTLTDISISYPSRQVVGGLDLLAQPGRRFGLVGENGVGKSTLLKAIAGTLTPRARVTGVIDVPDDLALLGQEPPFRDDATIGEVLAATLRPLRAAVADVERLSAHLGDEALASAYDEALERAVASDAWDADRRAEVAAGLLGLGTLDPGRTVGSLSGGQRTRLALAALMTRRPACLLLDEPTNHLDDEAIEVLTEFLVSLPGVVLLASHDRVLLDDVCTDLVDLDPSAFGTDGQGGRRFGGGWTAYEESRRQARRRWEDAYLQQQEELERLRAATRIGTGAIAHDRGQRDNDRYIYGFKGSRVDRTLARRKKDAERRLEIAEREQVCKPPVPLRLRAPLTGPGDAGRVVLVRDLVVESRLRLDQADVQAGEHLLVSGENGSGKSTLLGVLAGRIRPTSGTVQVGATRVRELVQDVRFEDPRGSAQATYAAAVGPQAAPLRELGLLRPRDHRTPVGLLSTGQRRRLALAIAVAASPDLLLLDEPTNHLSLSLAGELEEALQATVGTVVLATHDRWLRRRWTGAELRLGWVG